MKRAIVFLALVMGLNTDLLAADDEAVQKALVQARAAARKRDHGGVVKHLTAALALKPGAVAAAGLHQARGEAHFKLAKIKESIADFDAYLKVNPERDPHHWMRGISYYYSGEFVKGHKQFERHQTVNSNDVENAVWHFLCKLRATDFKTARKSLIPIKGDGRVPMMEVHALFAGKSTPEKVMAKALAGKVGEAQRARRVFYANLYLALWFEALGKDKEAAKYLKPAAAVADDHGYMGDVARVHAILRKVKAPKKK
tara:strand:+ start:394 stop:1161 length:768 start_codon:yes stop_codon:yes gene_type:complete